MLVLIAGSRGFNNYELLKETLHPYQDKITEIVSGMAKGADSLGVKYSQDNFIPLKEFPANWEKNGKVAGVLRNNEMAQYLSKSNNSCAFIFWDGQSKGTENMISLLEKYNIQHEVIKYE